MEVVVFLFPLLHLPSKDLNHVLKMMEAIDLIAFSLISNFTKSLVVPFNLKCSWSCVRLSESLIIHFSLARYRILFDLSREARQAEHNAQLIVADTIEVTKLPYNGNKASYQWTRPGFGIREWINHLKDVTHNSNTKIFFYPGCEGYDIGSVAKTLKGLVNELKVAAGCSAPYGQLIYESVLTPKVRLGQNPYPHRKSFQKILVSNYDSIDIEFIEVVSLEELLVTNSKYLISTMCLLTMDTFNKFLKMLKMGCTQKLRYMFVPLVEDVVRDTSVILKGIDHTVVDRAQSREFPPPIEEGERGTVMNGGYDIHGVDGMKATLFIDNLPFIELFIWN